MERIIPSPVSYREPMSTLFPHLSDPRPSEYRTLADTLGPIEEVSFSGVISHNPGQTSNPTVVNQRSTSSPPIPFAAGGQSSAKMVSIHSNIGGESRVRVTLPISGVSTSTRQTSIVGIPTVLFPPTHTTMVNSPSISG